MTRSTNVKTGTIIWNWLYDDVREHKFDIPNSYYIPHGNICLLIPQHWANMHNDNKPIKVAGETTIFNKFALFLINRNITL